MFPSDAAIKKPLKGPAKCTKDTSIIRRRVLREKTTVFTISIEPVAVNLVQQYPNGHHMDYRYSGILYEQLP